MSNKKEQMAARAVGEQLDQPEDGSENPYTIKASIANYSTWVHFGSRFCLQQRWDEIYFPAASLEAF